MAVHQRKHSDDDAECSKSYFQRGRVSIALRCSQLVLAVGTSMNNEGLVMWGYKKISVRFIAHGDRIIYKISFFMRSDLMLIWQGRSGYLASGFQPCACNSNSLPSREIRAQPSSLRVMCPIIFTSSIASILEWSPIGTVNSSS